MSHLRFAGPCAREQSAFYVTWGGIEVLRCAACGRRSDELGKGWVAHRRDLDVHGPDEGPVDVQFYCPSCAAGELGYHRPTERTTVAGGREASGESSARPQLEPPQTFAVTMVRPGVMPTFEIAAYEYFGRGLPLVGETIVLRRTGGLDTDEVVLGYVTRVDPLARTPIAVTEVARANAGDDLHGG
jgi:hypothetical protein